MLKWACARERGYSAWRMRETEVRPSPIIIPNLIWDLFLPARRNGERFAKLLSQRVEVFDHHRDPAAVRLFHDLHGAL